KSAMRCAGSQAVSIGTKANTMLLMSTEFKVSMGPMATASESALLCVPSKCAVSATRPKPMTLPVITPATRGSPPRTSGLSTARAIVRRSEATGDGGVLLSETSRCDLRCASRAARGSKRVFVVRMVGHFLHVFGVDHFIVGVEHEDGAALDAEVVDQSAVG